MAERRPPLRALVLSGGGAKGAFQVGAVRYLVEDAGFDFRVLAGVSTGSLNAVKLAHAPYDPDDPERSRQNLLRELDDLERIWREIRGNRSIYRGTLSGWKKVFWIAWRLIRRKPSLLDDRPLWETVRAHVDPARVRGSGRELRIGVTSLQTGAYRSIDQNNPDLDDYAIASAAVPVLMTPRDLRVRGAEEPGGDLDRAERWVDGGLRNITPLGEAFAAIRKILPPDWPPLDAEQMRGAAPEMYVVLASPLVVAGGAPAEQMKTVPAIGRRLPGILENEILREDIAYACAVNQSVLAYCRARQHLAEDLRRAEPGTDPAEAVRRAEATLRTWGFPFTPHGEKAWTFVNLYVIEPDREWLEAFDFVPDYIAQAIREGRERARKQVEERRDCAAVARWLKETETAYQVGFRRPEVRAVRYEARPGAR